ncbi:MAG: hypothetical protein ACTSUO_07895 [Candidatus Thorarchaeota archaeon]
MEVVNIVAPTNTCQQIDFLLLAKQPFISYNPSRYFCAYFKDETMQTKVSLFHTGKLIAVGAKSEKRARRDLLHTVEMPHRSMKMNIITDEIVIRNVVITVDLGYDIDLEALQKNLAGTIYEPEQFPRTVIRLRDHDVTVLAFASEKLVIAGLKSTKGMKRLIHEILQELNLA